MSRDRRRVLHSALQAPGFRARLTFWGERSVSDCNRVWIESKLPPTDSSSATRCCGSSNQSKARDAVRPAG